MESWEGPTPDLGDPATVALYDEVPLWSAPFGLVLLDAVELRTDLTVLDVGCGTGFPLLELAERLGPDARLHCVDPWVPAMERLQAKVAAWKLGGRVSLETPRFLARVDQELVNKGDRPHYLRGSYSEGIFRAVGKQESHALFGLSRANAFCRLEAKETIAANSFVEIIPF